MKLFFFFFFFFPLTSLLITRCLALCEQPQEPNSPEGLSESTGAVPDLEAPSYDSNVGGDWWAENNGGSTAQDGVDNKFASQLNGDWNQKVLQGQVIIDTQT